MGLSAGAIAAIVTAAAGAASTGLAISKGSPSLPEVKPATPPPPAPPPPAAPPPAPTQTQADEAPAQAKRRRALAYGVEDTLLVSPLGQAGTAGKTLLGG